MRFCGKYHPEMDRIAEEILNRISSELKQFPDAERSLRAIVLGGGYGRGEGGVFHAADGSCRLYNDLDLFVISASFLSKKEFCRWTARLKEIEKHLSPEYGVEVEFGPLTPEHKLKELAPTLMYQELIRGWHPVWGDSDVIGKIPEIPFECLPDEEALRLLLNRGAGLLLAKIRLESENPTQEDADFILRNIYKAALAAGDVLLLLKKTYRYRLADRETILADDPDFPKEAFQLYQDAVRFKFSPEPADRSKSASLWQKGCDAWLSTMMDQNAKMTGKISHSPLRLLKNMLLNLRYFHRMDVMHPRFRLLSALPYFLLDKNELNQYIKKRSADTMSHSRIQPKMKWMSRDTFLKLWHRFN